MYFCCLSFLFLQQQHNIRQDGCGRSRKKILQLTQKIQISSKFNLGVRQFGWLIGVPATCTSRLCSHGTRANAYTKQSSRAKKGLHLREFEPGKGACKCFQRPDIVALGRLIHARGGKEHQCIALPNVPFDQRSNQTAKKAFLPGKTGKLYRREECPFSQDPIKYQRY